MMRSNLSGRTLPGARPAVFLATAVLAFGLAATAWAGPGRAASQTTETVRDAEPASAAGVSVAIDPQTKKVRQPTPEEVRQLESSFKSLFGNAAVAPAATYWADGTVSIAVPEEYLNVLVARINPDGSVTESCVNGAAEATAFVQGVPPAEEK